MAEIAEKNELVNEYPDDVLPEDEAVFRRKRNFLRGAKDVSSGLMFPVILAGGLTAAFLPGDIWWFVLSLSMAFGLGGLAYWLSSEQKLYHFLLNYYFLEVPQGRVVRWTTTGGGYSEVEWHVCIKGTNRMNQERKVWYKASADRCVSGYYTEGKLVSFPEDR